MYIMFITLDYQLYLSFNNQAMWINCSHYLYLLLFIGVGAVYGVGVDERFSRVPSQTQARK